jgi:4-amino-4-deoxy-L-arabinose transferase-like glycosyltransferase
MNDTKASAAALGVPSSHSTSEPAARASAANEPGRTRASTEVKVLTALAAGVGVVSLLVPLRFGGLWAPYELDMAELSRRIAVALHGAARLVLQGQENTVPILSELGKGQLPFSCVALGFQLFGLSDWAGRLPLALWGVLGVLGTYALVSRLADRVSAAFAAIVLATMPLYFLQARTLLGDAVTIAAVALATSGLALATFVPAPSESAADPGMRRGARALWALLGLVGLAAGFASRGVLVGVACPALGVGVAWLALLCSGSQGARRNMNALGAVSLGIGLLALGLGVAVLLRQNSAEYLEVLGSALNEPRKFPSHESVLHVLGFALFPWSAALPFLLAVVLGGGRERPPLENALVICLLSVFSVALAIHVLVAPYSGQVPFSGTFALAGLLAVAFRDLEREPRADGSSAPTRLLALGIASLLIVLCADLRETPARILNAFFLGQATFPDSFVESSKRFLTYGSLACLALLAFALAERSSAQPGSARPFAFRAADGDYQRWPRALQRVYGGRLLLFLISFSLATLLVSVLVFIDTRFVKLGPVSRLGAWRSLARWGFLTVPVLVALPWLVWLARDSARYFFERTPIGRARFALASLSAFALAMSLGYYPALANHLSPRNVFEAYRRVAGPGEPLAVLGKTSNVAPYYARGPVTSPAAPTEAMDWLLASDEQRWLVLGQKDLAQLNALYRQHVKPVANLPVVDATSSEVMLATNRLPPGRTNVNPVGPWISNEAPTPEHPLDVDLEGQLRCLGWTITDLQGHPVNSLVPRRRYQLHINWQVLRPVRGNWKTFVHIDGFGRRLNADHDTLEGKYPFRYWHEGDFVTDVHTFELEPQFSAGNYKVFFGLYSGNERLKVRRGAHDDNRIVAGEVIVR